MSPTLNVESSFHMNKSCLPSLRHKHVANTHLNLDTHGPTTLTCAGNIGHNHDMLFVNKGKRSCNESAYTRPRVENDVGHSHDGDDLGHSH